jgi:cytochrome P450
MTVYSASAAGPHPVAPPPECPAHSTFIPLYGPEFEADPRRTYAQLRRYGPAAPVEIYPGIRATLVTSYEAALDVLRNPATFRRDPRPWQDTLAPDCPLLPIFAYRQGCVHADGAEHARLRSVMTDCLDRIDPKALRASVEAVADSLIDQFGPVGQADLVAQYCRTLPMLVFFRLYGCLPADNDWLVRKVEALIEASPDAGQAYADLMQWLYALVASRRQRPEADVPSWFTAHPARLSDDEVVQTLLEVAASSNSAGNLIGTSLRLLFVDDRLGGDLSGGSLPIEDALDEVLWQDTPVANYAPSFPVQDVELGGVRLPAREPVIISFAALNADPTRDPAQRVGNRAHLSWSAGPHACPAQRQARLIASVAIERLLDRLPGMELAVPAASLTWRPGFFARALAGLPVRFPPTQVPVMVQQHPGSREQGRNAAPSDAGRVVTSFPDAAGGVPGSRGQAELTISTPPRRRAARQSRQWRPWRFLAKWWRGE